MTMLIITYYNNDTNFKQIFGDYNKCKQNYNSLSDKEKITFEMFSLRFTTYGLGSESTVIAFNESARLIYDWLLLILKESDINGCYYELSKTNLKKLNEELISIIKNEDFIEIQHNINQVIQHISNSDTALLFNLI